MIYPDDKKPVKKDVMKKAEEAVRAFRMSNKTNGNEHDNIQSDVLGSYTGMFYDGDEPDQDADDL
ncbi:MAG: hypothetical protein FWF92_03335 [Oscillospiraceae bacterium]|nr:hypothetical protein [Oscillospiraceae bacterium]